MTPPPSSSLSAPGAFWMVLGATVLLSLKGVFATFAYATGVDVPTLLLVRFALALPLIWLVAAVMRQARIDPAHRKDAMGAVAAGMLFLAAAWCDFTAVLKVGVIPSRLVLFTFPVIVIALDAIIDRRPPSGRQVALFALIYGALVLALVGTDPAAAFDAYAPRDLWWAAASAVAYAVYLRAGQRFAAGLGAIRFTALAQVGAVAALLPVLALAPVDPVRPTVEGWLWLSAIVVFATVVPLALLVEGTRRWGAARAGLVSLASPPLTALAAWLLLDETMSVWQWAGLAAVVGGIAWLKRVEGTAAAAPAEQEAPLSASRRSRPGACPGAGDDRGAAIAGPSALPSACRTDSPDRR